MSRPCLGCGPVNKIKQLQINQDKPRDKPSCSPLIQKLVLKSWSSGEYICTHFQNHQCNYRTLEKCNIIIVKSSKMEEVLLESRCKSAIRHRSPLDGVCSSLNSSSLLSGEFVSIEFVWLHRMLINSSQKLTYISSSGS